MPLSQTSSQTSTPHPNPLWLAILQAAKEDNTAFLQKYSEDQDRINWFYLKAYLVRNQEVIKFLKRNNLIFANTSEVIKDSVAKMKPDYHQRILYSAILYKDYCVQLLLLRYVKWAQYAKTVIAVHKERLAKLPASKLIGVPLSPYHSYLANMPLRRLEMEGSETYHRSAKSPLKALEQSDAANYPSLSGARRAHIGDYRTSFERVGDCLPFCRQAALKTSSGDSTIYDMLLQYKWHTCQYIVAKIPSTAYLKVGSYHELPCLLVHINKKTIPRSANYTEAAYEEWVNFLISFFVGLVNYEAYTQHVPIELIRRSSFGFLTPTISPVGASFRINIGIIPQEYADIVANCLIQLDNLLNELFKIDAIVTPMPCKTFYGTTAHRKYLSEKYKTPELDNELDLLWQKVEKGGKTTLQNIMRTPYARDGIAAAVFKRLHTNAGKDLRAAFFSGLDWVILKMMMKQSKNGFVLGVEQAKEKISYPVFFKREPAYSKDDGYWQVVKNLTAAIKNKYGQNPDFIPTIASIESSIRKRAYTALYQKFELLNQLLKIAAIDESKTTDEKDGYASDSECEGVVNGVPTYSKKLIVSNGMRAIWSAIEATQVTLGKCIGIYISAAYYEVAKGQVIFNKLESIRLQNKSSQVAAKVIVHDVNACVTNGEPNNEEPNADKILVLDVTSATTARQRQYIEQFVSSRAKLLLFVSSGLKHEQCGDDGNSYGTVRVISKNRTLRDSVYLHLLEKELPVLSMVSNILRRNYKSFGAVPTSSALFNIAPRAVPLEEAQVEPSCNK